MQARWRSAELNPLVPLGTLLLIRLWYTLQEGHSASLFTASLSFYPLHVFSRARACHVLHLSCACASPFVCAIMCVRAALFHIFLRRSLLLLHEKIEQLFGESGCCEILTVVVRVHGSLRAPSSPFHDFRFVTTRRECCTAH